MSSIRRAVIDVGTNSIKLLVAEVERGEVRPLWEESRQTRLGHGFYQSHRLQPEPIAKSAAAVADLAEKARAEYGASLRVIATSAARDAKNPQDLVTAIKAASGLEVQIISGDQEADWAYQGVRTDPELAQATLLLLDVGGGSTELILGQGEHKQFRHSFPLGTVRLLERLPHSDPPTPHELATCREWLRDFLKAKVLPKLAPALGRQSAAGRGSKTPAEAQTRGRRTRATPGPESTTQLVGTGGTASILGCMEAQLATFDRQRLEATRLDSERMHWHTEHLWALTLERRRQIVGLPPNRADVILTGAAIYEAIMHELSFSQLRISTRGLRFAAVAAQVA